MIAEFGAEPGKWGRYLSAKEVMSLMNDGLALTALLSFNLLRYVSNPSSLNLLTQSVYLSPVLGKGKPILLARASMEALKSAGSWPDSTVLREGLLSANVVTTGKADGKLGAEVFRKGSVEAAVVVLVIEGGGGGGAAAARVASAGAVVVVVVVVEGGGATAEVVAVVGVGGVGLGLGLLEGGKAKLNGVEGRETLGTSLSPPESRFIGGKGGLVGGTSLSPPESRFIGEKGGLVGGTSLSPPGNRLNSDCAVVAGAGAGVVVKGDGKADHCDATPSTAEVVGLVLLTCEASVAGFPKKPWLPAPTTEAPLLPPLAAGAGGGGGGGGAAAAGADTGAGGLYFTRPSTSYIVLTPPTSRVREANCTGGLGLGLVGWKERVKWVGGEEREALNPSPGG